MCRKRMKIVKCEVCNKTNLVNISLTKIECTHTPLILNPFENRLTYGT